MKSTLDLRRWSQAKLAEASGLNFSTVSRMLSTNTDQRRGPSLGTVRKIQAGLLQLTGRHYSFEQVLEAIIAASVR